MFAAFLKIPAENKRKSFLLRLNAKFLPVIFPGYNEIHFSFGPFPPLAVSLFCHLASRKFAIYQLPTDTLSSSVVSLSLSRLHVLLTAATGRKVGGEICFIRAYMGKNWKVTRLFDFSNERRSRGLLHCFAIQMTRYFYRGRKIKEEKGGRRYQLYDVTVNVLISKFTQQFLVAGVEPAIRPA